MPAPIITINHVFKDFGSVRAVNDANFEIAEGEFFSLLGPSGCGKTTLLRMLAGFEVPTRGSIHIDGRDVTMVPPNHRPVNMVFQNYAIFPHLNVASNIAFGMRKSGLSKRELAGRIEEMLDLIRLPGYGERTAMELSGGQRQRVALARALIKQPKVLLLDEPLGALDKKLREQMQIELRQLQQQVGITFVFVTHDQEEALTLSDRNAVMAQGDVLEISTPGELYEAPGSRFVADFIGTHELLRLHAERVPGWGGDSGVDRARPCPRRLRGSSRGSRRRLRAGNPSGEVPARLRRRRGGRERRPGSNGAVGVPRRSQSLLRLPGGRDKIKKWSGRAGLGGAAEPREVSRTDQRRGSGCMADVVGRCRGAVAGRGAGGAAMRGVSSQSPVRGRPASSAPFRLILGLALLHGCGHVASEDTNGGFGEIDVAERVVQRMEGIGTAVDWDVRIVVLDCDVKVEGKCGDNPG